MKVISITKNPSEAAEMMRAAIEKGKIVIYPTDTVYGIGCNALNKKLVDKIYKIKNRSRNNPLSVMVQNLSIIKKYCEISKAEEKEMKKYLPGPYTLLIRRKKGKSIPVSKTPRLGIRIPDDPFILEVMKSLEIPIVTTSANISGEPAPKNVQEINPKVAKEVYLIFDGGETKTGKPSTIIDLPTKKIIREFK